MKRKLQITFMAFLVSLFSASLVLATMPFNQKNYTGVEELVWCKQCNKWIPRTDADARANASYGEDEKSKKKEDKADTHE